MTDGDAQRASEINRAFHRILHVLLERRDSFADEHLHGLSFAELHILVAALRRPDLILKDLREQLGVPQTTLSSMVARLERRGFVKRAISSRDLRSYGLSVTPLGRRTVELHHREDQRQAEELASGLAPKECDELVRLLDKVADHLEPSDPRPRDKG